MIERIEYRAQMARLRLSHTDLAQNSQLSKNCVRAFLNGGDIRLSSFLAITEALGGDVQVVFRKVAEAAAESPPSDRLPL
jgi:DNA-binding Xre family transcriptional regulator